MVNNKLKQVITNIYAEKDDLRNRIAAETNDFVKHDLEFELDTVTDNKLYNIYVETVNNIPAEKDEELKKIIVNILGSEADYDRFVGNVKINLPNATFRDVCMCVASRLIVKDFDNVIDELSNLVDDEAMNKVADLAVAYVPTPIDNTPIHPYASRVAEIKNGEKFNSMPAAEKEAVAKQLDEINEAVKESPRKYSEAQTDFDADYERIINANNNKFFKKYVEENKEFAKAFEYSDLNFLIKDDVAGDPEKVAIAKSPAFSLTKETQDSILKVWKKMDELGIITAGNGAESGSKIYGFQKLYDAKKELGNALRDEKFEHLQDLKNEYEKQVQNVRDMYAIIKTELNPTPDKIPGNVQNFREDFVPAEFKNNISINAAFNAMYNTYSIVKSLGVAPEEFLSRPQQYIDKIFNDELTKFHIDKIYNGLPFEETLARVYSDRTKPGINSHGIPRMVSTLTLFEKDPLQKQQDLIYAAVQSGKIATIYEDKEICYNYFSEERTNTFVNLLFVNPEDRNFNGLRSYDAVVGGKLQKTTAFDLADYLKAKNVAAEAVYERISGFVTAAYKLTVDGEKQYSADRKKYEELKKEYKKGNLKKSPEMPERKSMSEEQFVRSIKDIQQGVTAFLMLADPTKDPGCEKLEGILKNPAEAFGKIVIDESLAEKLSKLSGKDVLLSEYKQKAIEENTLDVKDIRLKETVYNKQAETILKEANKISKKVAAEKDAKKVEALQKQSVAKMNELKQLQKTETERLDKEFRSGNIPAEYYKQRVENIVTLRHNDKVAVFDDGLNKDKFIKSTGLEQLTRSEANKLFECEIAKQKTEKELFANKQFLQKNNLISTNKNIEVQKANFEQIDVNSIESVEANVQREPLIVEEAKIETSREKAEPQQAIDPAQKTKMP